MAFRALIKNFLYVLLFLKLSTIDGATEKCTSDRKVLEKLANDYHNHKRPSEVGVTVSTEIWIQDIPAINDMTSDFEMIFYMTQSWTDEGLSYNHLNPCKGNLSLTENTFPDMWTPNTCFVNSKSTKIQESPSKNIYRMIYASGLVWLNHKYTVVGPCKIDLSKFPMDEQICHLTLESYNYNADEVKMRWVNRSDPIIFLQHLSLSSQFMLTQYNVARTEPNYPAGYWNELTMTFTFKRRIGWYILHAYLPTYFIVLISWISFCLGPKMLAARTILGVNSLLALLFHSMINARNLPKAAYIKAIDVWMLGCLTFICLTLLELALVRRLVKDKSTSITVHGRYPSPYPNTNLKLRDAFTNGQNDVGDEKEKFLIHTTKPQKKACCLRCFNCLISAQGIDAISCVLFPILFIIFNYFYWSYYL